MLIQCQNLSKTFRANPLFSNLSLTLSKGDRVGIVGVNGSGKSTLLKILLGLTTEDEGSVARRSNLRLSHAPQVSNFDPEQTILAAAVAEAAKNNIPEEEQTTQAQIALSLAGFDNLAAKINQLSGGWLKRLTVTCAAMGDPDLVLLDEPSNHLDWEGLAWLEQFLKSSLASWVMISHDRNLLNATVTRILDIDRLYPDGWAVYDGDYDAFLAAKQAYRESLQEEHASLRNKLRREDAWLKAGVKARTTKSRHRMEEVHKLSEQVANRTSRLRTEDVKIQFDGSGRQTKKLLEVSEVDFGFDARPIIQNWSFVLAARTRLGVLGPNGIGKSCLLKLLEGSFSPTGGTITRATDLKVVYFDQKRASLPMDASLKNALCEDGDHVMYQGSSVHVNSWAQRFGLDHHRLATPVRDLSGGEQAKVLIARLLIKEADVLLLDEPTNDLDIATIEVLEQALRSFPGSVVLITHDRRFLETTCNHFIGFVENAQVRTFADVAQWLQPPAKKDSAFKTGSGEGSKLQPKKAKKLSYKDQRDLDKMADRIEVKETAKSHLEQELEAAAANLASPEDLTRLSKELGTICSEIDELYERWSVLTERQAELNNQG